MADNSPTGFAIRRGVNISHWLPQPVWPGAWGRGTLAAADLQRIRDWGFDHVRLAMYEHELFGRHGQRRRAAFAALGRAVETCARLGLRVVADLHRLRAQPQVRVMVPPIAGAPQITRRFVAMWRELSAFLRHFPRELLAYDLLNEIRMFTAHEWHALMSAGLGAVREREPQRLILAGPNTNRNLLNYQTFEAPQDPHLLLAFHFYRPTHVTHHGIKQSRTLGYRGPVNYPGLPIAPEHRALLPQPIRDGTVHMGESEGPWDRQRMAAHLGFALGMARQRRLPVYCAEFGCSRYTPPDVRARWMRDWLGLLHANNVPYCIWCYRGDFGLLDEDDQPTPILDLVRATWQAPCGA